MNIRVLRESGGIGDIVRILPAIRGLREKYPGATIHVFVPPEYSWLIERAGDADKIIPTPPNRRQRLAPADEAKFPYLKTGIKYDLTVDLYCPAFRHEADMKGEVWNDRIELFCKAADAWPADMRPVLDISVAERDAARKLLIERSIPRRKGWIALQPFSTDPARDWPPEHWRALAAQLIKERFGVFVLDSMSSRTRDWGVPQVISLPLPELAAVLCVADLLVCPDSGLAHLCGAAGGRALGLTASQSGAVLYRHYPRHSYIQPEAVQSAIRNPQSAITCHWPCYWSRPAECQRLALRNRKKTCPLLATLPVDQVARAARNMIEYGDGRTAVRGEWQGEFCASAETIRAVERAVPARSSLLDAHGVLGHELLRARLLSGVSHDLRLEACHNLPLPHTDRSQRAVALLGITDGDSLSDWLWEIFRVLEVGGTLYTAKRLTGIPCEMGFTREGPGVYRKASTWPQRGGSVPPPNQDAWELAQLIPLIAARRPRTVLEIGTKESGWIAAVAPSCAPDARFLAVDIKDYFAASRKAVADALAGAGQSYDLLVADSLLPATVAEVSSRMPVVDLLHVDGLHTYEACKADAEHYGRLVRPGGLIVVHDIWHVRDVGVRQWWNEMKAAEKLQGRRTWEFHTPKPESVGIGVIEA